MSTLEKRSIDEAGIAQTDRATIAGEDAAPGWKRPRHRTPAIVVSFDVYPVLHGAQRSLLDLLGSRQFSSRFQAHYLYTVDGDFPGAIRAMGVPCTQLSTGPLFGSYNKRLLKLRARDYVPLAMELAAFAWQIRSVLRCLGADLLHCNTDRATLMSFLGARWAGCPLVTHIRRESSFGLLDRIAYRGSTEMIWVSRRVRDGFGRANGIPHPKGRVIYNGRRIGDMDAPATNAALRAELKLPPDAIMVLTLASFSLAKDHETLVAAARIACPQEPRLYFLLAGEDVTPGQQRLERIRSLVAESGLQERVLFLGHRTDVGRLLRGSTLLVNTSREEALGGSLIEAIGYGVPCVATDTGGTAEIVPDGRCGLLVPRGDAAAVADRVLRLVRDDMLREEMSRNGRVHFAANFTSERMAERTAAFFEEIIARRRGRTAAGAKRSVADAPGA